MLGVVPYLLMPERIRAFVANFLPSEQSGSETFARTAGTIDSPRHCSRALSLYFIGGMWALVCLDGASTLSQESEGCALLAIDNEHCLSKLRILKDTAVLK